MNYLNILVSTFFLLGISLNITSHFISVGVVGPVSKPTFLCLIQNEFADQWNPYAIIRIYQNSVSPPGIDPYGIQTITNAYMVHNPPPHLFPYAVSPSMEICRGIDGPSQIIAVNTALRNAVRRRLFRLNFLVVLKIEPSPNPTCSWESFTNQQNCDFLKATLSQAIASGWVPILFSTAPIWSHFFGSTCNTIPTDFNNVPLLWYANYLANGKVNETQSFDDFVPFGGFSVSAGNVYMKQTGGNVTVPLCNNPKSTAFIDYIWGPSI